MKGPAVPRPRKPPSPHTLNLLCSFNGAFLPHHPSGNLRYVGGETRIISLDRRGGLSLSNLLSRLSDLLPNSAYTINYQAPDSPSSLVPIATDNDVLLMIAGHDRIAALGKVARLRLFICGYVSPQKNISCNSSSRFGDCIEDNRVLEKGIASLNVDARARSKSSNQVFRPAHPLGRGGNPAFVGNLWNVSEGLVESGSGPGWRLVQWKFFGGNGRSTGMSQCRVRNHQAGGDARYYKMCPYVVRHSQIATSDAGVQRSSGLRTRFNILKIGQGRSSQNYSEKPLDVSGNEGVLRKLVLQGNARKTLHQPSPFSPPSISNAVEPKGYAPNVISMLPKPEMMLQLDKEIITEDNPSNSRQSNADIGEKIVNSCLNDISLQIKKDLVYNEENQEGLRCTSVMKKKENMEASTNICSKNADKLSCNHVQNYSHLASKKLQTIKNCDIEEIRVLGSGAHGTVFYGKWKGSDVAIKRLKPSYFSGDELGKDRLVADFWKEARLLGQLHHPNVVAFYGVVTDGPVSNLATVTEYMVNGSLKQVLKRKDRTIDRRKRLIIAMDAAFGMEYLHEKNVVHFDLKSHNLLVNMKDPHRPVCKIGDLGLSKVKQRTLVSGGVRGTIPWMAPELLTCKTNMVTVKVDVYSFGIVMWELLTGEEPYANMCSEMIIAGIIEGNLRPEIPSWCDPAWRSLMEGCWSSDPSSRPSFAEIAKELRAIASSINIR